VDTGKRPQTVLVVGHAYVLGVNRQKFELLASRHAVQCILLVPRRWRSEWGILDAGSEDVSGGVRVVASPVLLNGHPGGFLYSPLKAWRILRRTRPDLVHVEQELYSLAAFEMTVLARRARVPVVLFAWENLDRELSWLRRKTRRFTLSHVDTLVAGNEAAADLATRAGFRGRTEILPQMGVDLTRFSGRERRRDPGAVLRVGFAGRLVAGKGVDLLLEACAALMDEGLPLRLTVIGSGPASPQLAALQSRLGMDPGDVDWVGSVPHDEVPAALASLDVIVLPSRSEVDWEEQFGRVLIEAMAEGLPVVGSSSGEIPNVIGRSDLVFREDDAMDLARILRRLTKEPAFYGEASRSSLDRVRSRFSLEHIVDAPREVWLDTAACGCD